jgi:hypothetical protein
MGALFLSHYLVAVFLLQTIGEAQLLANRFVPPALLLLGPVLVNILLFHALMAPEGLPIALFATVLGAILFLLSTPCLCGRVGAAGGNLSEAGTYPFAQSTSGWVLGPPGWISAQSARTQSSSR